jgi:16S rRNA (uracil1498-N3)-methyltransferase
LGERDAITISDGAGRWASAVLTSGALALAGDVRREPAMHPARIAAAIPKGDRLEWMVQKLTEVGVTEITLVDCARSVVRWPDERAPKHVDRLQRVVRQAAMQSRRVWLPRLCGPVPVRSILGPAVYVADPAGEPLPTEAVAVVIGPEGGFTAEEVDGAVTASLGPLVMRVETAAIAAAVLMVGR